MIPRRLLPLATATVAALALAGCTGSEGTTESPAPSSTTSAADPTSAAPSTPEEEGTESPSEPPAEPTETSAGGAACLEGTWLYSASEIEATFEEMMSNVSESPFQSVDVEGDSRITFDGSTMVHSYDPPQVLRVEADAGGLDMVMEMTWSGQLTGTTQIEGDTFRLTGMETGEFDVSTRMLVGGEPIEGLEDLGLNELIGETGRSLPEGQVEYECSGDSLRLTAVAPHDDDFRFDYQLTRD